MAEVEGGKYHPPYKITEDRFVKGKEYTLAVDTISNMKEKYGGSDFSYLGWGFHTEMDYKLPKLRNIKARYVGVDISHTGFKYYKFKWKLYTMTDRMLAKLPYTIEYCPTCNFMQITDDKPCTICNQDSLSLDTEPGVMS